MHNRLHGTLAAIAILASATASAQTLSTTVNVDRVVEPTLRQAVRPVWTPQLLTPANQDVRLTPAEYTGEGMLLNSLTPLPPLMWADIVERTPYRGYASVGYFPAVNMGANAGYRFVDTDRTAIGAWAQYNGYQYTRLSESNDFSRDVKLRNHFVTVGAYGTSRFGNSFTNESILDAGIDYTYASVLRPIWTRESGYNQGSNELNARLSWRSSVGRLGYGVWTRYQYFGFNDSDIEIIGNYGQEFPAIRQSFTTVHADLAYLRHDPSEPAIFEIGLEWQHLHTAEYHSSMGLFKIHPRFNIGTGAFRAALGLKGAFGYHDVSSDYIPLIMPDIRLSWAPASLPVSAYANCLYDSNMIPASRIFALDPYVSSREVLPRTHTLRLDFGVNLGAFRGLSAKAYVSCGVAAHNPHSVVTYNSDQLPAWASPYAGTEFDIVNQTAWLLGLRLGYAYHSLLDAYVSYEHVIDYHYLPRWYEWLDGAKSAFRAHVGVRPMPRLSVALDYELRAKRCLPWYNQSQYGFGVYSLRNSSLLDLTASYEINPRLTLFLRAENLLNCNYLLISALPAQGIHGLLGATLKF